MKIYIGSDHRGFEIKRSLVDHLRKSGHEVEDVGDDRPDPADDFPVFAQKLVTKMLAGSDHEARGILLCASGQGMCMAANRHRGIRAALGWSLDAARESRNDDDSNILCLPAEILRGSSAAQIVDTWLGTPFANAPRFIRRNKQLDEL